MNGDIFTKQLSKWFNWLNQTEQQLLFQDCGLAVAPLVALEQTFRDRRLVVSFLGAAGSGKVSLLNRLLGRNLLPPEREYAAMNEISFIHAPQDGLIMKIKGNKQPETLQDVTLAQLLRADAQSARARSEAPAASYLVRHPIAVLNHKPKDDSFTFTLQDLPMISSLESCGLSAADAQQVLGQALNHVHVFIFVLHPAAFRNEENERLIRVVHRLRPDLLESLVFTFTQTDQQEVALGEDTIRPLADEAASLLREWGVRRPRFIRDVEHEVILAAYYTFDQQKLSADQRRLATVAKDFEDGVVQNVAATNTKLARKHAELRELQERMHDDEERLHLTKQVKLSIMLLISEARQHPLEEQPFVINIQSAGDVDCVEGYDFSSEPEARKHGIRAFDLWYEQNAAKLMQSVLAHYQRQLERLREPDEFCGAIYAKVSGMYRELTDSYGESGLPVPTPGLEVKSQSIPAAKTYHKRIEISTYDASLNKRYLGLIPYRTQGELYSYNIYQALITAEEALRPVVQSFGQRAYSAFLHIKYEQFLSELEKVVNDRLTAFEGKLRERLQSVQSKRERLKLDIERLESLGTQLVAMQSTIGLWLDMLTQRKVVEVAPTDDWYALLQRCEDGTTLIFQSGDYRLNRPLTISKSVIMIGESLFNTTFTILPQGRLEVADNHHFWCRSLTFLCASETASVSLQCAEAFLVDCTFKGIAPHAKGLHLSCADGWFMQNRAEQLSVAVNLEQVQRLAARDNQYADNRIALRCGQSVVATFDQDMFREQLEVAVVTGDDTQLTLTDCLFERNRTGMECTDRSRSIVRRCQFQKNSYGLQVLQLANAELEDCQLELHDEQAVMIGDQSRVSLKASRLSDNTLAILCSGQSKLVARTCDFVRNDMAIRVPTASGVTVYLHTNQFQFHGLHTIRADGRMSGRLINNTLDRPFAETILLSRFGRLRMFGTKSPALTEPLTLALRMNKARQTVNHLLSFWQL